MNNQILVAIDVPWMVSPSISALHAVFEQDGDAVVSINVFVPDGINPQHEPYDPSNPRVTLLFLSAGWAKMCPVDDNQDPFLELGFLLDPTTNEALEAGDYLHNLNRLWQTAQRCPLPGVYETRNSQWLSSIGPRGNGLRHYVVFGRGAALEILATQLTWSYALTTDESTTPET
jgi:hypothetical protein